MDTFVKKPKKHLFEDIIDNEKNDIYGEKSAKEFAKKFGELLRGGELYAGTFNIAGEYTPDEGWSFRMKFEPLGSTFRNYSIKISEPAKI